MALAHMLQLHNNDTLMMIAMQIGTDLPAQPGFGDNKHAGSCRHQLFCFMTAENAGSTIIVPIIRPQWATSFCDSLQKSCHASSDCKLVPTPAYMVARLNMASGSPNSDPLTNASLAAS